MVRHGGSLWVKRRLKDLPQELAHWLTLSHEFKLTDTQVYMAITVGIRSGDFKEQVRQWTLDNPAISVDERLRRRLQKADKQLPSSVPKRDNYLVELHRAAVAKRHQRRERIQQAAEQQRKRQKRQKKRAKLTAH